MRRGTRLAVLCVVVVGASMVGDRAWARFSPASGATITVTTTADDNTVDGNCSLREAIQAANTDRPVDACAAGSGADTIALDAGGYGIKHGWLNIASNMTIEGVGQNDTYTFDAGATCATCGRDFLVSAGGQLTLTHMAVYYAPTAFRVQGTLDLDHVDIGGYATWCRGSRPDFAAAIDNRGTANLHDVFIAQTPNAIYNAAGATFTADSFAMHDNGPCAVGASIENLGTMTLRRTNIDGDLHDATNAISIDNNSTGHLSMQHSWFRHNTGGHGGEILSNTGSATITDAAFDDNTFLPVLNHGTLAIHKARFHANQVAYNAPGAIFNDLGASLAIDSSTIDHNIGPVGGGIDNIGNADATLTDDTITDNAAIYGPGSARGAPPPSGGITNGALMMIRNVTIARNELFGYHDWHYHAGGIVTMPYGYTALSNSIVSDNTAPAPVEAQDCYGAIHSLGYNLVENNTDCFIGATTTGNLLGISAHLYPLADNGGPTMTSMPPWNSPEVDNAGPATPNNDDDTTCTLLDQRGIARPLDGNGDGIARCDIGSVEHP